MTVCEWCNKEMGRQNLKRHQETCVYKNEIGMTKDDFQHLKHNYKPDRLLTNALEVAFSELKQYLTDTFHKTTSLYKKLVVEDQRDPEDRLNEMHVSAATKANYLSEWKLFNKWLKKNKRLPDKESADTYLSTLKCRPSTLKKKQYMLEHILQHLIDNNIKLNRVKMRISYVPKYAMTEQEIDLYLKEQKRIDQQDYLIQKLMATYGLRVNSVASLRIRHLEYLNNDFEQKITFPDSKVKKLRRENIDHRLVGELDDFKDFSSNLPYNDEDFVFYPKFCKHDERMRAHEFCCLINKRIKESKVIKKTANFKYTSHMFRKTVAYNLYHKGVEELKARAREAIGQSQNSTAISSYIDH
jgi:hypothetical protein